MRNKYIILILTILTFLTVVSFTQEKILAMEEKLDIAICKKTDINTLKEKVGKLNIGMNKDEVELVLGEPGMVTTGRYLPEYTFSGFEILTLEYTSEGKLYAAYNKDRFNLLSTDYSAKIDNLSLLIDGNTKPSASDLIAIINAKIYIPVEYLAEQLRIKVSLNAEVIQQVEPTITGIAQMKEASDKLSKGMTIEEVKQNIGEPSVEFGSNKIAYFFDDMEILYLDFKDGKLYAALTKDDLDLLSKELIVAKVIIFSIFINGEEPLTSNPIVTINDNIYIPIEDLAEQLGIKVSFNEEKQQLEITTK